MVLKTREHLAAVKPVGNALVLELMHFADEVADPKQLNLPKVETGKKEMDMALSLVDAMTATWQPQEFHDEYTEALMKVIEEKIAAGGKELPAPARHAAPATNLVDIVKVLQESLNQRTAAKPGAKQAKPARTRKA